MVEGGRSWIWCMREGGMALAGITFVERGMWYCIGGGGWYKGYDGSWGIGSGLLCAEGTLLFTVGMEFIVGGMLLCVRGGTLLCVRGGTLLCAGKKLFCAGMKLLCAGGTLLCVNEKLF